MALGTWTNERRALEYIQTVDNNPFINLTTSNGVQVRPHPKQMQFLLVNDVEEVLIGGGTRSGKSWSVLMAAAQYVQVPGYNALILRRTFPELEQAGGFIPESKTWWSNKASWNNNTATWTFPSGATIRFGHMDHDDDTQSYQGGGYQFVNFDEVTWHTEYRYTYMFSRLTRLTEGPLSKVPVRMRSTANPNGKHMDWVKKRFVSPKTRKLDTLFIPALVADNPSVDAKQVEGSLSHASKLMREQMLFGNWDAVESGQFKREWLKYYQRDTSGFITTPDGERFLPEDRPRWQTCDPAFGLTKKADNFVISTWCLSPKSNIIWLDCVVGHFELREQIELCQQQYRRWKPQFFAVEEVMQQRHLAQELRRSTNPVMVTRSFVPRLNKAARAIPAFHLAAQGRILLPLGNRAFPLDTVESELLAFTGENGGHRDDTVDSLSMAIQVLDQVQMYGGDLKPSQMIPTTMQLWQSPRALR